MCIVNIDVISLQSPQRLFRRGPDGSGRQSGEFRMHSNFGRDDDLFAVTTSAEPAPNNGFRFSAGIAKCPCRVNVSRIDKITAGSRIGIQDGKGGLLIGGPTEDVTT